MMKVFLRDVRFHARHGITPQEIKVGNEFSLTIEAELADVSATDNIEDTLSYVDLYEIAKEEIGEPSALIETVAINIAKKIKATHKKVTTVSVEIVKINPPIPGLHGTTGVRYLI